MILILIFVDVFGPIIAIAGALNSLWRSKARLHLSTAIILVFLSGIFLGLNFTVKRGVYGINSSETHYGFPFDTYCVVNSIPKYLDIDDSFEKLPDGSYLVHDDILPIFLVGLWNAFFALAIILGVWVFCEKAIERQAVKSLKPVTNPLENS